MKHLNNHKIFESKKVVEATCERYGIYNYTINDDGSIDVDGDVSMSSKGLMKIPLNFNRVNGVFYCSNNVLLSLEGCPKYTRGDFLCYNNNIISLEGPNHIGGTFYCSNNNITSLDGCPEYIGNKFMCYDNPINSIARHFIHRKNKNNLIELFNYCDVVQDMNVIYDRLEYFFSEINVELTDYILKDIQKSYKIIK